MKGAAGSKIHPRFFKFDIGAYYFNDAQPLLDLIYFGSHGDSLPQYTPPGEKEPKSAFPGEAVQEEKALCENILAEDCSTAATWGFH